MDRNSELGGRLIQRYFDEIAQDTGKVCYGVDDTLRGLELGAVETLIVWENLDITRHVLRDSSGKEVVIHTQAPPPTASNAAAAAAADKAAAQTGLSNTIAHLSEVDRAKFIDQSTGAEMEQAQDPQPLLEWLAENYQTFGANLEFVTNRSQEGAQFQRGMGGIGGLLRYKVDFSVISEALDADGDEFYDSDEDDIGA